MPTNKNSLSFFSNLLVVFCFLFLPLHLFAGSATADLSSNLTISQTTVETGQPYANTITIKNENALTDANVDAAGAEILYNLPAGSSYSSFSGSGWNYISSDSSTVIFIYNASLTNQQTSNPLILNIQAPSSVTTLNPDINVSLSGAFDPDLTNNTASGTIDTGKSNLTASKAVSKTLLSVDELFAYTITLSNNAAVTTTVDARDIAITDTIPASLTFQSFGTNELGCTASGNNITCNQTSLALNTTKTVVINVKASPGGGSDITNQATINAASSDYNTVPFTVSAPAINIQQADVTITKTLIGGIDANNALVGSNVTYRLTASNLGATDAIGVEITDTLPTGVTFSSATSGCSYNSGTRTVTCTLGSSLVNGSPQTFDIVVIMPSTVQTINNEANITTTSPESDSTNNSSTLTTYIKGADLNINKTPKNGSVDIGSNYTYTIYIENVGLATAKNIVLTDTLDPAMTYVSDTGGCNISEQVLTCNISDLAQNQTTSFTVTVTMPTNSLNDVTNSISIATSTDQQNSVDITDSATTHITGPNLNITKNASVTDVGLGKPFSYTINVSNVNTAAAVDATITDQLPSGVTITGITNNTDGWSCPSAPITGTFDCTLATFSGGQNSSITFEATAPTATTGQITNTATISHSLDTNDGSDTAVVNVTGVVLDISKSASATAEVGGLIDYNITISNNSHTDAEDLTLNDNLSTSLGSGYTINSIIDSAGWNCGSSVGTNALICSRTSLLAEGATSTIHFKVNVPNDASLGTVTNSASVTTTTIPSPTETATASTIIEGADIVVIPPTTLTAIANENVVFTVEVRNDGSATAKNVELQSYFNTNAIADFTNIKVDCNNDGTYETTTAPYTCSLGDIAKNSSRLVKISATAPNYDSNFLGHYKIRNGSPATTTTSQSNYTNDNVDWEVEIHGADLVVTKNADVDEIAVNGIVTYTINVENQWKANATNITLRDDILQTGTDGFKLITSTLNAGSGWSCTNVTDIGFDCSYSNSLAQGQSTSDITIQAIAPNTAAAVDTSKDNQVSVVTDTAEQDISTTNTNLATVIIRGADLDITKTVSPNPAQLNEQVTYTITVANSGLADANATYVDDTLLAGHTNISTSGCDNDGSSVTGNNVHCTLGTISQNQSKTFTIIANAPTTNGDYVNTATTSSNTPEVATSNNSDSVTLEVRGADLVMNKIAPARVAGNSYFTYTLNIQNIGHSTAYGATLSDTLPTDVNYVGPLTNIDTNWNCSESSSTITCQTTDTNLSIPPGYNQNIVSFLVQANPAHYWINNTAVVDTNTSESNTANNTDISSTEVIDVDLSARKLINGNNYGANENYVAIAETFTYTLQVRNTSLVDINITDVNVTDIIPTNVTNISISADSRFTCNTPTTPGSILTCSMNNGLTTPLQRSEGWINVATITVDAIDAVNFDINDENNNIIVNQYNAITSLSDQNLANNAPGGNGYLETNTLVRGANMSIVKTVSSPTVGANQTFTYNLAVKNWPRVDSPIVERNRPSTTAQGIEVKDTLPADVTYVSATGTNWSCSEASQIVTCNYTGTMDAQNSSSSIIVTVQAPNSHNQILTNEANVTTTTPELVRLLPDNTDTVHTTTAGTDITVSKTGPTTAGMGDTINYTITVENTTQTTASNIYVLDTFPSGATYVGNISNPNWSLGADVNGSKQFIFDQNLSANSSTTFTVDFQLPNYTGIVRNRVDAFTSTAEVSTPNVDDFDTDIQGASIKFASIPSQNPNPVGAYKTHQYIIQIKNEGLSNAKDINVTLTYDDAGSTPGWSDVNGTGSGWSCGAYNTVNHTILCQLPTLAKSSTSSTLTISSIAPNYNGDIINSINVVGLDDTNATTGETKSLTTTVRGSDLKITKSAHDPDPLSDGLYHDNNITVGTGKPINFKISVLNDDLGLAKDVNITDNFPAGFSDLSITSQGDWTNCSISGQTLTCSRNELDAGVSASDIIVSATAPGSIETFTNTAQTNTTTQEVDTTNNSNSVDIKIEGATLSATLNPSKTEVAMDEVFTYVLDITNTGRNDAIDVNITDIINSDFTYLDFNGSDAGWSCAENNNTVSCTQPSIIAYSGNTILKLNVKAPTNTIGTYPNAIDINSNSIENPIHVSSPDVRVAIADLVVDINATPSEVLEDRNVTYVINIKDINISTAYDINVTQTFNHTINALHVDNNGTGNCSVSDDNQSASCLFDSIAYNQDKNITITATMPFTDTIIDPLTSTVRVTTTTVQEDTTNDENSVDVRVMPIMPVVNYRFDECKWDGTNGEVIDSISGVNGTVHSDVDTKNHRLVQDSTNFSPIWRVGEFTDNSSSYIRVPNNIKLQITGNQTVCFWIKPKDDDTTRRIITKRYNREFYIDLLINKRIRYYYGDGTSSQSVISSAIEVNKWTHACISRDVNSQKLKWYLNGINTNESQMTISNILTSSSDVLIGSSLNSNLDEVEIYNIALDDRAINDIYNFERANKNYDGTDRPQNLCGVDLQVTKTSSPNYEVGAESDLIYTIKVKNLSAEPVTEGFVLSDNLPPEVEYMSDSFTSNWSGCAGDQNMTCTFLPGVIMDYDQEETVTIYAKTKNLDKVNITNTATATAVQPDTDSSNNSSSTDNRIIGTDLSITKTATPALPTPGENFIYTVSVKNESNLANARDLVMIDKLDSRLTYHGISYVTNEVNASVNCAIPDANNTIYCDINKLSMGNYIDFTITVQSPTQQTGLLNEGNITSITKDTDLSNNFVSLLTDTNTTASSININILHEKIFNKDASVNRYGNIATIGNTMLVANNLGANTKLNDINSSQVNVLGGGYTNSSSASLDIINTANSSEDNITIEYAGLFWGGHVRGSDKNETGFDVDFGQVKFITPDGTVHFITADKNDTDPNSVAANRVGYYHFKKGDENNITTNIGDFRIFYGAKADITDIVRGLDPANDLEGIYSVADMQVTNGIDTFNWAPTEGGNWERYRNYGYFGGWSMVVIYSVSHRYHRDVKFKNLSSFSGFRTMLPKTPGSTISLNIDIEGFITPLNGDIESTLFSFVQGGDRELSLESMSVEDKDGIQHNVKEDLNNTTNIFNSTITLDNFDGTSISKNPDLNYNVGTDIDQFNLNSNYDTLGNCISSPCYLSNRQDKTKVEISVSQANTITDGEYPSEKAFAQMMTMSTQIFTPDFIDSYKECFKLKDPLAGEIHGWVHCDEPLPLLRRGDIMKYRITAINTGDDYAKDVYIIDNLPKEVTFEDNSSVVSFVTPFNDPDTNQTCSSPQYNYDNTVRDSCSAWLNDQVDGNITAPFIMPTSLIDVDYNGTQISGDKKVIKYTFPTFNRNHVAWIEFNTTVNSFAGLGNTIQNSIEIKFTNPTLDDFGYPDSTVTQASLPVVTSPISFNWDNINILVRDIGRDTVGAKVVNQPFDLNISLTGISSFDIDVNTTIRLNTFRIVDTYNSLYRDIWPTINDYNTTLGDENNINWFTNGTLYDKASKELGFDMNISVHDGNYTASRIYPQDFNSSAPYAGDVFTTRPASFSVNLAGATVSGAYNIVNAAQNGLNMSMSAPDINGVTSDKYTTTLSNGSGISIGLDNNFSTNTLCINQADLNTSDAIFTDGLTPATAIKYNEVGVVKLIIKDSNWTARDSTVGDCNTTSVGDNNITDTDGIISCSIDGNSTSILFKPDHFAFTTTTVSNHNNFTYMVENNVTDPMFSTITTTLESRNADDNVTTFFSGMCFADDVNVSLSYNATSKDLNSIKLYIANESNLTATLEVDNTVTAVDAIQTNAYSNDFSNGTSNITLRLAVDRNQTTPLQPLLLDSQDLNGSVNDYLGIANANSTGGTDINSTNDLYWYYGRVHAPDYRFAGDNGNALIFYEVYCNDCNTSDRNTYNILGNESADSVNWYINTLHTQIIDGNVSLYNSLDGVKFGASPGTTTTQSSAVLNGIETIHVIAPSLPYKDKVEMNSTTWTTFNPNTFLLEFQDEQKDWAGQGELGHIIDTNVSKRSNRRIDW